jgi:hypothetical protein
MKRSTQKASIMLLGLLTICCYISSSSAESIKWEEFPIGAWEAAALDAFASNDYDDVIDIAEKAADDPNRNTPLFIYLSHAQKYYIERNQNSAAYFKQQYHAVYSQLSGKNLPVLTRLVAMPQLAWNKKINKKFLDAAFERSGAEKYLGALLFYLTSPQPDVSKAAVKGLQAILQKKRNIVLNGGSINKTDRAWMSDPRLIERLVMMSGQSVSPATGFISKLPAFARKKMLGGANACLALIEDPALPYLKTAASMGNPNAAAAIQLINDARASRLANYPDSTWYSATGDEK